MECKKIVVLCPYEFPVGMASTTRILAYCQGLLENGVAPEIYTFRWISNNENKPIGGVINGIPYKNSHLWNPKRGLLYKMLVERPRIKKKAIDDIIRSNEKQPIDFVFLSFDDLNLLEYYAPKLKRLGFKLVFIGDEFPEPMRNELRDNISLRQIKRYKKVYKYIDARILMTKSLQKFYDTDVCEKPTYILPSIINTKRFSAVAEDKDRLTSSYFCYTGGLEPTSDNLDIMIKAFAKVIKQYPEYELRLYGTPSPKNKQLFERVALNEGISENVKFMGRIGNDEIPEVMAHAKIVMTSQPDNMRVRGSFSTKIGEYLASGTPTLATRVGSLPLYFEHGREIFYAKVNDVDDYANQIINILEHYEKSINVASCGRSVICNQFNAKILTSELLMFLSNLSQHEQSAV